MDLRLDTLFTESKSNSELPSLAIHLHVFYLDTLETLLHSLSKCGESLRGADLWVSTDSSEKARIIRSDIETSSCLNIFEKIEVRVCTNRGRNLGPLFIDLWPDLSSYNLLLHLHGKRSIGSKIGDSWRQDLLETLLPNNQVVKLLRNQLATKSKIGLVIAQPPNSIRPYLNWGNNFAIAALLSKHLNRVLKRESVLVFPAGMMFWCQPAALEPLAKLCNSLPELPPEPLAIDGTYLHALERLVVHCCEHAGYRWKMLCRKVPSLDSYTPADISVWEGKQASFQDAAALLAFKLRQEQELRHCAETNFEKCTKQLQGLILELQIANDQRQSANSQIRMLMQDIAERDRHLQLMHTSMSWRLTSPLRQLKAVLKQNIH